MAIQFCKSCQQNNVNTRVEWRDNPDKPGKKMMWDVDKDVKHTPCPYFKADPNWKAKKIQLKPEDQGLLEKLEQETQKGAGEPVTLRDIKNDLNVFSIETYKRLSTLERLLGDFGTALAKISIQRASDLK